VKRKGEIIAVVLIASAVAAGAVPATAAGDWPSYDKTLTSERFSDLAQINTRNIGNIKVLSTFASGTRE